MKKHRSILALILVIAMVLTLTACAKRNAEDDSPASPSAPESAAPSPAEEAGKSTGGEAFPDYSLSYNVLGAGVWILDYFAAEIRYFAEDVMGFKFQAPSANFTADQMRTDCQNLLNSGIDGHVYYGAFDTLTPSISEMFENAKVPFSMPDQMPGEASREILLENPYFAGATGVDAYAIGYQMGERAAELGYKKALIVAGAIGDTSQDGHANGFTDGFTDNGGQVIASARCSDPSEGPAKADDLFAAYGTEADCVYGGQSDFVRAAVSAMGSYNVDIMAFGADSDDAAIEMIENGLLIGDGGHSVNVSLAAAMLVNYLDGHPVTDAEGNAPIFDKMKSFIIDQDNAQNFKTYWIENHPITDEMFQSLLYRYNPDVSYEDWQNFLDGYNYEFIMAAHG